MDGWMDGGMDRRKEGRKKERVKGSAVGRVKYTLAGEKLDNHLPGNDGTMRIGLETIHDDFLNMHNTFLLLC
jgi:hypothetical protein